MRLRGLVLGVALMALAAAACSGGDSGDSEVPEASAALRVLAGTVEVQPPSADFGLAVDGQALEEGYTIRTGADGRAAIEYFDGSITRLDENTTFKIVTLQILDNEDQSKVIEGEQSEGSTYSRVTELTDSASRFDVTTPTATASVQGTIYAIFVNPVTGATTVAVLDGSVAVGGGLIPAGFMVEVDEEGNAGDPVPIPDDLIDSDWIVFNCEEDGGVVDADGNCVFGSPAPTTTTTTVVEETTTTSSTTTTTTSTTTTTVAPSPAPTTTTTVPGPIDHIVISPSAAAVGPNQEVQYSAEGFDVHGNSLGAVAAAYGITGSSEGYSSFCIESWCQSDEPGDHTVTGSYDEGVFDTAVLTVVVGSVAVSVGWSSVADLDLHVIDPSGEEIYYSHSTSASGGSLLADVIPGCGSGAEPVHETISWVGAFDPPVGGAFIGSYQIAVVVYNDCGEPVDFVVTIYVNEVLVGTPLTQDDTTSYLGENEEGPSDDPFQGNQDKATYPYDFVVAPEDLGGGEVFIVEGGGE